MALLKNYDVPEGRGVLPVKMKSSIEELFCYFRPRGTRGA